MPAEADDMEWLFSLHKAAMGPLVEKTHGWNEDYQRQKFQERPARVKDHIVWRGDTRVGMVSCRDENDAVRVLRIEIHPRYQMQGIGTRVMRQMMDRASAASKDVALQVNKLNSARRFYEKLGFIETSENETHYLMRWTARELTADGVQTDTER